MNKMLNVGDNVDQDSDYIPLVDQYAPDNMIPDILDDDSRLGKCDDESYPNDPDDPDSPRHDGTDYDDDDAGDDAQSTQERNAHYCFYVHLLSLACDVVVAYADVLALLSKLLSLGLLFLFLEIVNGDDIEDEYRVAEVADEGGSFGDDGDVMADNDDVLEVRAAVIDKVPAGVRREGGSIEDAGDDRVVEVVQSDSGSDECAVVLTDPPVEWR
ncbi:hypothetical protein FBU30_009547 [Linnemannia zychae]|nr:hypothetical protein FBU30_009547 [Linnemannia zychae]